jgi:hypothetical protein
MFYEMSLHGSCGIGRCIVVMKLPVTTCPQLRPFSSYCIPQLAKDFDVVLLAWRSVLVLDSTFIIKKKVIIALTLLSLGCTFFRRGDSGDFHWEDWAIVSGS